DLYRPLSLALFTLEWGAGNGQILLFHTLDLVFYLLSVLVLWRFGRTLLPAGAAWLGAAWFAIHPVHVEAVSAAINQSETLVGIFAVSIVALYLDWRRQTHGARGRAWLILALYVIACLIKESALVFPGLLLAAELFLVQDSASWGARLRRLLPWGALMLTLGLELVALRTRVLQSFSGTFTAEALLGLDMPRRALTMLGVVPQWVRLTFWPAHLRLDYSPGEFVAATHWGGDQTLGLLILLAAAGLLVWAWRRQPVIAFGLAWFAVAIFPVTNILVPTGILLAERTLFLPTMGIALSLGAALWALRPAVARQRPLFRKLAVAALVLVGVAGVLRSAMRMYIWRNTRALWTQSLLDAPDSYRVLRAVGDMLNTIGEEDRWRAYLDEAKKEYAGSASLFMEIGDHYRRKGDCTTALPEYRTALKLRPDGAEIRASLIACLFYQGEFRQAQAATAVGRGYLPDDPAFRQFQKIADTLAGTTRGVQIVLDSLGPDTVQVRVTLRKDPHPTVPALPGNATKP
ncbi:MAG: tetratricopeptide repeat protein, partial [Gemmatimonadales bacterium]